MMTGKNRADLAAAAVGHELLTSASQCPRQCIAALALGPFCSPASVEAQTGFIFDTAETSVCQTCLH